MSVQTPCEESVLSAFIDESILFNKKQQRIFTETERKIFLGKEERKHIWYLII